MFKEPFVIIDLETSGIDPKVSKIIEVAAIRFEKGKEVARYSDLIKINEPLDDIITVITGITDADLEKDGKPAAEVLTKVQEMVRGAYIIGHNVNFDASFLKAAGLELDGLGLIDSIPIAQVLMPQVASYSLESLTADLGISHEDSHRAMADVEATFDLLSHLWGVATKLPPRVLTEVQDLIGRSAWEGGVFLSETVSKGGSDKTVSKEKGSHEILVEGFTATAVRRPISVNDMFGEEGVIARHMNNYEIRHQQMEMSNAIAGAFENSHHLICEAPTGVGKSLAYLTAAADMAITNKSKVVISTNTVNLQAQLHEKDVPLLQSLYKSETGNPGVRVALLKGRTHYLCLRRLAEFKRRPRFTQEEVILLGKIMVWRATTEGGDSGDLNLSPHENLIWDFELSADQKYCTPQKCKALGGCPLADARKAAEEADIIVVNHALLCADLETQGSLLPDYRYLVVDEAHHFEEVGTRAFGLEVKEETLSIPVKTLQAHLDDLRRRNQNTLFAGHSAYAQIDELLSIVPDLQQDIHSFFDVVALFTGRNVPQSGFMESLLIDPTVAGGEEWMNLGDSLRDIHAKVENWLRALRKFASIVEGVGDNDLPGRDDFLDEFMQEIVAFTEQLVNAHTFFDVEEGAPQWIRFITANMTGQVTLHMYPLMVGPLLKEKLYDTKDSVVLTSATLGVMLKREGMEDAEQHPFTYVRRMLSLDDRFEELILDSPFDFEKQVYVITPSDLQPLVSKLSIDQVSKFMKELIVAVEGGLLGLFTSHGALQNVYMNVMKDVASMKTKVLAQRLSGGRGKILKAYMSDPTHSALLGTNSFWEGVDIQGEALTTLVIHKLPFDVPSDPIHSVRGQMFQNGFMEYTVPRAILRFRQGFGRLIRSQRDYGVMILLDDRVQKKQYGQMFLQALPPDTTIEKMPIAEVPAKVREWLDLMREDA